MNKRPTYENLEKRIQELEQCAMNLRESWTRFRSMMEAMRDPIYICSPDFRVEYMNPAMIKRVGHDATGEHCFKSLHGLDEKCTWCQHEMIQHGTCSEFEIVSPKDNRSYLLSQTPVVHKNGSISKMTVYKDMTELRAAQAQFLKAQKMEAIGTLAGGIAHDFNNILSAVMGFAQLAFDQAEKGSVLKDDIREVLKASSRAKDLVGQILAFARQEVGVQAIPMRVSTIVKEAVKLIKASIPASVTIKDNVFSPSIVLADPSQIHQIVMNLCTNAAQAMDDAGFLTINLEDVTLDAAMARDIHEISQGAYLQLTIADTGKGIPPDLLDKIFEPYFTTKAVGDGTGLGLSTVHGIVKSCGGGIKVESKQGKGSVFNVYFPVVQAEDTTNVYHPMDLPSGTEKILLVDDELPIVKMAVKTLKTLGYTVTGQSSSLEALKLFESNPKGFDLVITDMTMPDMTGDRLAEKIMKIRPDIPVILSTGYSRKISPAQAEAIGIKSFMTKPFFKDDLAVTIRAVLDNREEKPVTGRILVIDDDPQIRLLLKQLFEKEGFEVVIATNGKEGSKSYRNSPTDLIITDIIMPEKEGIELIRELKKDFPNVKIIAISGGGKNNPEVYLKMAGLLGAAKTFTKPFDIKKLMDSVKLLLKEG